MLGYEVQVLKRVYNLFFFSLLIPLCTHMLTHGHSFSTCASLIYLI